MSLRVAISPCPNDTFTFGYLILGKLVSQVGDLSFEYHDIHELNRLGHIDDAPDVLKCSYAEYPSLSGDYEVCDAGSALGRGVGPLLVGSEEVELQDCREVLIPGGTTTAALLNRRFGPKCPTRECRYDEIMPRVRESKELMGVIIHESRFTYPEYGLKCHVDLGECWEREFNLPLPLGGVILHKRNSNETRGAFTRMLKESLKMAWNDSDELKDLIREHAQEMDDQVCQNHIDLYVNEHSMELGETGRLAIETLCSLAEKR